MLGEINELIYDPKTYWAIAEETAKFLFTSVFLAGLVTLFLDIIKERRLRKIRKRAAQFLWSQAFTATKIQQDIEQIREMEDVSEEQRQAFISSKVFGLKAAATLLQNFVQDHANVLPDKAFLHTSLLRMNGQVAMTLADILDDESRPSHERINLFIAYTFQDNESGEGSTMQFGLLNIGEFFVRSITPIVTDLGMPTPPDPADMIRAMKPLEDA